VRHHNPTHRQRREEGQAATELALVLPLLVVLLLGVVQVTLVARDQILVVHAAREAARQAAVDARPQAVRAAAVRAATESLKADRIRAETSHIGGVNGMVTVRIAYVAPTGVPLLGPLLPDVTLQARATMRREADAAG
jgi:Flp pilus assembly protein TadG